MYLDTEKVNDILERLNYKMVKELGAGAFGVVYECKNKLGDKVAVKVVASKDKNVVKKEVNASKTISNIKFANIEEGAKFFKKSSRGMLIEQGIEQENIESEPISFNSSLGQSNLKKKYNLNLKINTEKKIPEKIYYAVFEMFLLTPLTNGSGFDNLKYRNLLKSITNTLFKLQKENILHCDIKPDNILCSGKSFKLGDWGEQINLSNKDNLKLISDRGTKAFKPPECDGIQDWSKVPFKSIFKIDIYSLGASVLSILLDDIQPETNHTNIRSMVLDLQSRKFHNKYASVSLEMLKLLNLLKNMTNTDVAKRYDAQQVLSDSYFKNDIKR